MVVLTCTLLTWTDLSTQVFKLHVLLQSPWKQQWYNYSMTTETCIYPIASSINIWPENILINLTTHYRKLEFIYDNNDLHDIYYIYMYMLKHRYEWCTENTVRGVGLSGKYSTRQSWVLYLPTPSVAFSVCSDALIPWQPLLKKCILILLNKSLYDDATTLVLAWVAFKLSI